ncbi:hypothetical protein RM780_04340 [Streptomyces sp. DSM 44917]|uniref:MarR family transcriptional regulator n=1 Tax=Streptomyces boetiae TaxID=3075541 RepID=A0ABU2L3V4_9ACTN|nr:hypothetical protein [Streptomyces sp. DSM 44917]MDT0306192.1 hypothetical protein [Streptomyces sp. DSM 44917]
MTERPDGAAPGPGAASDDAPPRDELDQRFEELSEAVRRHLDLLHGKPPFTRTEEA